ncbi:preprotein translocase subunit YajC [Helicobacter sp. 11S03491-1]|uniref:preprotein translocase subunit YajC n=1 Tax=Helicobacter sp. 11S03491-1 TaxID=1476196 RepID=UPI000BA5DD8C|nr:preprotein translocase subunit YajC [Helicobacter sp. 11S03491-1]PAF42024.1 preprotein translocase subunit YajC [Helicobacter sp. 11S03491-1]
MQNYKDILTSVLPLLVLFAIFYFFIIRPQRMQQKKHKEMLMNLQKGDKIVAQGGFICEVIKPEDTFFTVKLNDDTIVKLAKEYVAYKIDNTLSK